MELAILVGLQAAGKTAFFERRLAGTHVHVSKDRMRSARDKEARQRALVADALAAGRSVAVDNMNLTVADRAPLVALARAAGARVVGYFFEPSTRASVARNAGREGRARVPEVAIFAAARRLVPPAPAEGFDELYLVRLEPEQEFAVLPWPGPDPPDPRVGR
jgi:predicted kinase